jgi:hypothetical protein
VKVEIPLAHSLVGVVWFFVDVRRVDDSGVGWLITFCVSTFKGNMWLRLWEVICVVKMHVRRRLNDRCSYDWSGRRGI